jgi:hypothetical protein
MEDGEYKIMAETAAILVKRATGNLSDEELHEASAELAKAVVEHNAAVAVANEVQAHQFITLLLEVLRFALRGGLGEERLVTWAIELAQVCEIDLVAFNAALPASVARLKSAGDH